MEDAGAVGVIGVFVGEADGGEAGGGDADVLKAEFDLFGAESGVDEDAGGGGGDIGGVAGAAAGEDGEL